MMQWVVATPIVAACVAAFLLTPLPSNIHPVHIPPHVPPSDFTGPYATNHALAATQKIGISLQGPETITFDAAGQMYGFTRDGWVIKVNKDGSMTQWVFVGGRPLAGKFDAEGNLYLTEASKGLLFIPKGSSQAVIAAARTKDGLAIGFADDIDMASDGKVYFSDASQVTPARSRDGLWGTLEASVLDYIEGARSGRLIVYDPVTREATTLLDKLFFANGVALGPNEEYVLVVETWYSRVRRYWLKGPKAGTDDMFIEGLPGLPDGISRGSHSFWVAIPSPRPAILALGDKSPFLRSLIARIPEWVKPKPIKYGLVVELDFSGQVLRTLQDPGGKTIDFITAVTEHKGNLYFGSLHHAYVGVYSLST